MGSLAPAGVDDTTLDASGPKRMQPMLAVHELTATAKPHDRVPRLKEAQQPTGRIHVETEPASVTLDRGPVEGVASTLEPLHCCPCDARPVSFTVEAACAVLGWAKLDSDYCRKLV